MFESPDEEVYAKHRQHVAPHLSIVPLPTGRFALYRATGDRELLGVAAYHELPEAIEYYYNVREAEILEQNKRAELRRLRSPTTPSVKFTDIDL